MDKYLCEICRIGHRTQIEAKACAFRDQPENPLPSLDFAKPVGHEGECF